MPFYEYECDNCKFYTELLQKISDPPLKKCPSCGKNQMRKLVSAPVFRLKGGGWYETDFKTDKEGKRNLAVDKEPDSVEKPAAKADSTDTKPAADAKTTESKPAESKPSEPKAEGTASRGHARPAAAAKSASRAPSKARPKAAAKSAKKSSAARRKSR